MSLERERAAGDSDVIQPCVVAAPLIWLHSGSNATNRGEGRAHGFFDPTASAGRIRDINNGPRRIPVEDTQIIGRSVVPASLAKFDLELGTCDRVARVMR